MLTKLPRGNIYLHPSIVWLSNYSILLNTDPTPEVSLNRLI
jgi:hypothetical protein